MNPEWFSVQDIAVIGFLVFLEGILSLDNALVLALMVRHLPNEQRRRALTYGVAGAIFFRVLALFFVTELIRFTWVKFLGGGYLVFLGLKELSRKKHDEANPASTGRRAGFWETVMWVELTDIAFAIDSILAAVALTSKLWVLVLGGIIGIVMMRFAASLFSRMLDRFPQLEQSAYLLVVLVGLKLVLEGFRLPFLNFHDSGHPAFWAFWGSMALTLVYGFLPKRK